MNAVNYEELRELVEHRSPQSVSLFMPTHRAGRERQQDGIRYKNLIKTASESLAAQVDSQAAADVMQPLLDLQADLDFWEQRSEGLACFSAPGVFRVYQLPLRVEEALFVNRRFHVRPLLSLQHSDARVYVLALTQVSARLFETTRFSVHELDMPELAPLEIDGQEQALQFHSPQTSLPGKRASDPAIYHGHGGPTDRSKKDAVQFFRQVDRAVVEVLRDQRAPLMLACVGYLAPLYESVNRYKHLLKHKVPGNPDQWTEDELREHAWQLSESYFQQQQQEAWRAFQQARGSDTTSDDLLTIVTAADQGRVDTLFLARGEERWGKIDSQRREMQLTPDAGDDDADELLDLAAARTIGNGGDVIVLESLPDIDAPAAATFRY